MLDIIWIFIGLFLFVISVKEKDNPLYLKDWPGAALFNGVCLYGLLVCIEGAMLYLSITNENPFSIVRETVWLFLFLVRFVTYTKKFFKAPPDVRG